MIEGAATRLIARPLLLYAAGFPARRSRVARLLAAWAYGLHQLVGTMAHAEPARTDEWGPKLMHLPMQERRAEQGILRPIPITVDLPEDVALRAKRVLVHYRLWGDPDWTTIQLTAHGQRFQGAIPCLEVSTVTGDFRYYIRAHDSEGRIIAQGASRAAPYVVVIKHDTALDQRSAAVAQCPDPADCPRGLPGCPSEEIVDVACSSDRDCEGGTTCSWRGVCERSARRYGWLSFAAEQAFGVVATAGACGLAAQEQTGSACYREDGVQYVGAPVFTNEPPAVALGPTRVAVGYDRVVYYDTTVGFRVSWAVLGQGPTPRGETNFIPLSISARVGHWFGPDLFAREGARPYAFVTGGYAMVDLKARTHVREDPIARAYQEGNDLEQDVTLWKRAGDAFVGAGLGIAHSYTSGRAVFIELSLTQSFPFAATVLSPTIGWELAP